MINCALGSMDSEGIPEIVLASEFSDHRTVKIVLIGM